MVEPMHAILFEDPLVQRLHPITTGRAAHAVACGSYRLVDWIQEGRPGWWSVVRSHLLEVEAAEFPQRTAPPRAQPVLLVNSRLVPSRSARRILDQLQQFSHPCVIREGKELAAAVLSPREAAQLPELTVEGMAEFARSDLIARLPVAEGRLPLLDYPHDVIRCHAEILPQNLEHRLATGDYLEVAEGVFVGHGAELGQHCVTDTRDGPILLDAKAQVGPHSFLRGPVYLGTRARVIEHASIKDFVAIGHTTKVGGEVEASVIEPYSNKQHHGFLGHSYLGSWINLGAGTCNSDLKNTYGDVRMDYRGDKVATGMQFIGCIIGDYSKTAINTSIFTGKTFGVCSMAYGFVTTNVPSFVNYARSFGQVTELPPDVMVATQQRMFARRNVSQRTCDAQLIRDMFELTRDERRLADDPLSL